MARIHVDVGETELITEWAYTNIEGQIEFVSCGEYPKTIDIHLCDEYGYSFQQVGIFISDIPKLIKALEAAYKALS